MKTEESYQTTTEASKPTRMPSRFYTFGAEETTEKEWKRFPGKLSGSAQPGYQSGSRSSDKRLLEDLRNGLNPKIDDQLIEALEGIYQSGTRSIFSVAHADYDRNPELVKYLWEHKYPDTEYITHIDGVDLSIKDYHAPTQEQLEVISSNVLDRLNEGKNVLVHCGFGSGRTGTVLASIYMAAQNEHDVDSSIQYIRSHYYPHAVEKSWQVDELKIYSSKTLDGVYKRTNRSLLATISDSTEKRPEIILDSNDRVPSLSVIEKSINFRPATTDQLYSPTGAISSAYTTNSSYIQSDIFSLLNSSIVDEIAPLSSASSSQQSVSYAVPSLATAAMGLQALYMMGKAGYNHIYKNSGPLADSEQILRASRAFEAIIYNQGQLYDLKAGYKIKYKEAEDKLPIAEMRLDILNHPEKLIKIEQKLAKEIENDTYGFQAGYLATCAAELTKLKKMTLLSEPEKALKKSKLEQRVKRLNDTRTDYKNSFEIVDRILTNMIDIEFSLGEKQIRVATLKNIEDKIYNTTRMAAYLKKLNLFLEARSNTHNLSVNLQGRTATNIAPKIPPIRSH